jgi:phosphate transport system permease protein
MLKTKIKNLEQRNRQEYRFKLYGKLSIAFSLLFLVLLLSSIFFKGYRALIRTQMQIEIDLTSFNKIEEIDLRKIDLLIKDSLKKNFQISDFKTEDSSLKNFTQLTPLVSRIASLEIYQQIKKNPNLLNQHNKFWISISSKADMYFKYDNSSNLLPNQKQFLDEIKANDKIRKIINYKFLTNPDSREAEISGVAVGIIGSIMVMVIFLALAFPIAIMSAFYLEEFAKKNFLTDLIEISINNLAAIPSIIYGLLGLVVYLQYMHLPRSSSLVGGMTLFMLVLPVIIIATRNTIRSIPQNIRDGAMAIGATKMQVVIHHLLPLSIPGIMTGTILAVSRALGETAPLLMIGMVAFIADIPMSFFDPATVLPVQIFLWSDLQETGFVEKTSLAILMLLIILMLFNLTAILLRKKFERKW